MDGKFMRRASFLAVCTGIAVFSGLQASRAQVAPLGAVDRPIASYLAGKPTPQLFTELTRIASSGDAASQQKAKFFLGRAYQQKYEITGDVVALEKSRSTYHDYIERYENSGTREFLSDARFYKALCYVEYDKHSRASKRDDALRNLRDLRPDRDPRVRVDHLTWKPNEAPIDYTFDARALRDAFVASIKQNGKISDKDQFLSAVLADLRAWCGANRIR